MSKRRRKSYKGELGRPIPAVSKEFLKLLYPDEPASRRHMLYIEAKQHEKMTVLLAHFGIKNNSSARSWYELALCLAKKLGVPALKIGGRGRGRTRKFGAAEFHEVEAIIDAFGLRGRRKFLHQALTKLQEICPSRYAKFSIGVFRTSYYALRKERRLKK
jgi:hypothetical protein